MKYNKAVSQMGWIIIGIILALLVAFILLSIFTRGVNDGSDTIDNTLDLTKRCAKDPTLPECFGEDAPTSSDDDGDDAGGSDGSSG